MYNSPLELCNSRLHPNYFSPSQTRIAYFSLSLNEKKSAKNSLNLWQTRITQRKVILVGIVRESLILVCFLDENYIKPRRELSFSHLENDNSRLNIVILPLIRGENHVIRGTITVSDTEISVKSGVWGPVEWVGDQLTGWRGSSQKQN